MAWSQPFQQGVDYRIAVELDDQQHMLRGSWELVYTNNSPEPLQKIWMHLWPNAYKDLTTGFGQQANARGKEDFVFSKPDQRGYIDSLSFTANGQGLTLRYSEESADMAELMLNAPLQPGQSITLKTPFRVKLPDSFSRLGHVGQQYQLTQWYPKPAVYDDEGWHPMPYLDQGEFFSEFGRYEVQITVPSNYVVGATGQLQEQEELEWLMAKAKDSIPENPTQKFPESSSTTKTLTYIQDRVHDFAWFADKRYVVRHRKMELASGRKVDLWSMYNDFNAEVWEESLTYMEDGIRHYSECLGEYPYDMATVIDGALSAGAGMEYPTITVLGGTSAFSLEQVIVHELGHNWFYGILASNERAHPWMDEGMNTYYEDRYFLEKYEDIMIMGQRKSEAQEREQLLRRFGIWGAPYYLTNQLGYQMAFSMHLDQPLNISAGEFGAINYGMDVYGKTGVSFLMLEKYWGKEKFDAVLQAYYEAWKFRHPAPEDLFAHLEEKGGEPLPWLTKGLLQTAQGLDFRLKGVKSTGSGLQITVQQVAGEPGPVPVSVVKNGEVVHLQWVNLAENGASEKTVTLPAVDGKAQVVLDPHLWLPETNRQNNRMDVRGIFRKVETPSLKLLGSLPNYNKSVLNVVPTMGINGYDGYMLGLGLFNGPIPQRPLSFVVMPMYAFGSGDLTGSYRFNWMPNQKRTTQNRLSLQLQGQRYSAAQRHTARLAVDRIPFDRASPTYQTYYLAIHNLSDGTVIPGEALPSPAAIGPDWAYEAGHNAWKDTERFSWSKNTRAWMNPYVARIENEVTLNWQYMDGGSISLRNYLAFQAEQATLVPAGHALYMDGGRDPLMEQVLFNRRVMGYGRQTMGTQGNFKGAVGVAGEQWMAAFNLSMDIPNARRFGLFADLGFTDGFDGPAYDAGIQFRVIPDILEFYLPLVGTGLDINDTFRNYRMLLRIDKMNPLDLLDKNLR